MYINFANLSSYSGSGSDVYDLSGNNYHGTLVNSAKYSFDSTNKYISFTNNNSVGESPGYISWGTNSQLPLISNLTEFSIGMLVLVDPRTSQGGYSFGCATSRVRRITSLFSFGGRVDRIHTFTGGLFNLSVYRDNVSEPNRNHGILLQVNSTSKISISTGTTWRQMTDVNAVPLIQYVVFNYSSLTFSIFQREISGFLPTNTLISSFATSSGGILQTVSTSMNLLTGVFATQTCATASSSDVPNSFFTGRIYSYHIYNRSITLSEAQTNWDRLRTQFPSV